MYITQLKFDACSREAVSIFSDCYLVHKMIASCFGESGRLLYCVESGRTDVQTVLVLSESLSIKTDLPVKLLNFSSKEYRPVLSKGSYFHFRLRGNASVMKNGKRRAINSEAEQADWITRKGVSGGFAVTDLVAVDEGMLTGRKNGSLIQLKSVLFQGGLVVNNPELFSDSLFKGVGPAKGFGFGLLNIARP